MQWTIPGTTMQCDRADSAGIKAQFDAMFTPGYMFLGQVCNLTGLEPYTVQNWVKRGFLPPPQNKRYSMEQLCRVITINMLKTALPMEQICNLIHYINGRLDDNSDDLVDDSVLYFMFVALAARAEPGMDDEEVDALVQSATADYQEPIPGGKERVRQVLRIMLRAWQAAEYQREAEIMLEKLETAI